MMRFSCARRISNEATGQMRLFSAPAKFTGRHMALVLAGFFGITLLANGTLAYFAGSSWSGLIVKNVYKVSQDFNRRLDRAEIQQNLRWQTALGYAGGQLAFSLRDSANKPLAGYRVEAVVKRAVHARDDLTVILAEHMPGHYRAELSLKPGLWLVDVEVTRNRFSGYRQRYRITVTGSLRK
jgi:nitrogen fixation protein FixH